MIPKDDVKALILEKIQDQEEPGLLLDLYWRILKWEGRQYQVIRSAWMRQERRQLKLFSDSVHERRH